MHDDGTNSAAMTETCSNLTLISSIGGKSEHVCVAMDGPTLL